MMDRHGCHNIVSDTAMHTIYDKVPDKGMHMRLYRHAVLSLSTFHCTSYVGHICGYIMHIYMYIYI